MNRFKLGYIIHLFVFNALMLNLHGYLKIFLIITLKRFLRINENFVNDLIR